MFLSSRRSIQLITKYNELVGKGIINPDPRQLPVVELLQTLGVRLEKVSKFSPAAPRQGQVSPSFSKWFNGPAAPVAGVEKNGLYVYGGCGTGKTMLMDMFFEEVDFPLKKRVHFHEFMLEVHARLHAIQKNEASVFRCNTTWTAGSADAQRVALAKPTDEKRVDPVLRIADEIFNETRLLCFDEFQVTFISDAIIMRRLFSHMFNRGIAIVATSNRPPDDLYLNGLNRELFMPFIPLLKEYCIVHNMESATDYRQMTTAGVDNEDNMYKVVFQENVGLERKFFRLVKSDCDTIDLTVQGRCISVRRAARKDAIALFSFHELCDRPLGSADYITIAKRFHTIFIEDIPKLHILENRDLVRRLITLIDALYDNRVKLVVSIKTPDIASILDMESSIRKSSNMDEVFAWDRTLSRLTEMTSIEYQHEHARRNVNVGDTIS